MARSRTKIIRSETLAANEVLASVVLRLMTAVNDFGIANAAMREWDETTDRRKLARHKGGRMYFMRMQLGHVFEALIAVKEIKDDPTLRALVDRCDERTIESFEKVAAFLGTPDHYILLRFRNNAAFHYDRRLLGRHLKRLVDRNPGHVSTYSMGTEQLDWYFEVADAVGDRLVVREVFNIPDGADVAAEADAIVQRMHDMAEAFMDFAGHFIRQNV
jgi:hypothetical protein